MKKYNEVKWSEVVRRVIIEYIEQLEEGVLELETEELLNELGEDYKQQLAKIELEKFEKGFEQVRDLEWKDRSSTKTS